MRERFFAAIAPLHSTDVLHLTRTRHPRVPMVVQIAHIRAREELEDGVHEEGGGNTGVMEHRGHHYERREAAYRRAADAHRHAGATELMAADFLTPREIPRQLCGTEERRPCSITGPTRTTRERLASPWSAERVRRPLVVDLALRVGAHSASLATSAATARPSGDSNARRNEGMSSQSNISEAADDGDRVDVCESWCRISRRGGAPRHAGG